MLARGAACPSCSPPLLLGAVCIAGLQPVSAASVEGNNLPSVGVSDPLNGAPHPPGAGWVAGAAAGVSGVELLSSFNLSQPPGQGAVASENGNSCAGDGVGIGAGEGAVEGAVEGAGVGAGAGGGGFGADWPFNLAQPPILLAAGGLTRLRGGGPGPPSSPSSSTEGGGFGLAATDGGLFVSFELRSDLSSFSGGLVSSTLSTRRGLGKAGSGAAAAFNIPQPWAEVDT